jgi:monoamine oxidase
LRLAGTAVAGTAPLAAQKQRAAKRVVVLGAGIAGLCCTHELGRRGHQVTVLEAARRAGGHVRL